MLNQYQQSQSTLQSFSIHQMQNQNQFLQVFKEMSRSLQNLSKDLKVMNKTINSMNSSVDSIQVLINNSITNIQKNSIQNPPPIVVGSQSIYRLNSFKKLQKEREKPAGHQMSTILIKRYSKVKQLEQAQKNIRDIQNNPYKYKELLILRSKTQGIERQITLIDEQYKCAKKEDQIKKRILEREKNKEYNMELEKIQEFKTETEKKIEKARELSKAKDRQMEKDIQQQQQEQERQKERLKKKQKERQRARTTERKQRQR